MNDISSNNVKNEIQFSSNVHNEIQFGRIHSIDERDKQYPISELLAAMPDPPITKQFWWDDQLWLDQGFTSQCTAYSWSHWLQNAPILLDTLKSPVYDPADLYHIFQLNDGIPGTGYSGSTVRAGAKVLKKLGFIKEYRWASDINDVIKALLLFGPIVAGTEWFSDMMKPDSNGLIKATGRSNGGHAYLLNGVDTNKGLIRIKNSWGNHSWGDNGHAYISFDDFAKLLSNHGEACIALKIKLNSMPDLNSIISDDIANG